VFLNLIQESFYRSERLGISAFNTIDSSPIQLSVESKKWHHEALAIASTHTLALGDGGDLVPVKTDFFQESLRVFEGQLTCCRLEHKGMSACDRQSLVVPLLGLYGELYRAAVDGVKGGDAESLASVKAFLDEIEKHQDSVFPPTFQRVMWRKNKKVTEEVMLFGDLIERMKHRIDHGQGFSYEEEATGTASTKSNEVSTPFIRHGASDFLRHGSGVRHGSINSASKNNIQIETAVGKLEDHIEE
jgi:hypothetical protein